MCQLFYFLSFKGFYFYSVWSGNLESKRSGIGLKSQCNTLVTLHTTHPERKIILLFWGDDKMTSDNDKIMIF